MRNRVLVVDDEEDICLLLMSMLNKMGFVSQCANDIESAEEIVKNNQFDSVFVDLNLPDGVGTDLFPSIRKSQNEVKIIVISAYDNEKHTALEKGADFFISKPFNKSIISHALEELNLITDNKH